MAPLSLKVVQDNGAVTRTVKVESKATVEDALHTVLEKFMIPDDGKAYGLFLTSADDDRSGVFLESFRNLEFYMLRDGDTLLLLCKTRNLRLKMLDGSVKTLQVDESQPIAQMMIGICARIGITNHDEYGLCYENNEEEGESKVTSTGTLTLKRAPTSREKDAKLEHMSKKLKTDDNVQWLDMPRTLRELEVAPGVTLLLKRRLFYTDRNVDARDPVQLNLLYVQTRDAILCGRHPVTVDKACEFAGIQCQIQYGDYQEDKHKAGYFELKELLPENLSNKSGLEKKIIKEFKKHQGLSNIEAKHVYTKTARDMPTYGVTFFVVKEKQPKGKKKLVPRLLGINYEAILRLDEETKEILQTWKLTQVMSYQVGKSHTFTLNFGDYSDKEYSVKTNDAVRIRDILQGYIDIIAKRQAGACQSSMSDGGAVVEDNIQMSKGTTMQFIKNNPNKIVEESFVGPTKIISYEPGQTVSQGTQMLTAQQLIITSRAQMGGEVPLRKEMSLEFVRRLNRMNSNSVKVVNLITSDDGPHNAELKSIVSTMENDMPLIASGVNEVLKKDMNADAKKRLQDELQDLNEYLKMLSHNIYGPNPGSDESLEAASRIADVSTQMYLGLDPITKRRSNLVRLSRQSFIEDEKVQANLHRASFISAATSACSAVDNASLLINQEYTGPALSESQVEDLERSARDKMRKLNGAVALFLAAHADPENIDYPAAVTSMNTINELIAELAKDGQALASTKDGASKQDLIDDINKLCDATRLVCSLTGTADHQKMQDVTSVYGPIADKLIFTFGRGRRDDKDNKIIDLAKHVGEKTSLLLVKATEVTGLAPASAAACELDAAGVQCAGAASDLLAAAMLTSPCIHEPHCQSALTASAETVSTAVQKLLIAAKPLVEEQSMRHHGDELRDKSLEVARALDALKSAYGNEEQMDVEDARERQRLKFLMGLDNTNKGLDEAVKELNKPPVMARRDHSPVVVAMLEKNLAQRMAEYNSAVAALLVATSDRDNPNYEAAHAALETINELMPGIVKDTKALAASKDDTARQAMLEDLKKLCEATRGICASASSGNVGDLNESAANLANTSNKLYFTFNPSAPADKENEILDIATAACTKASQMLADVYQLAGQTEGEPGARLDRSGARTADSAKALLTCAQLTAACIANPACQASLIQAADALSETSSDVVKGCSDMSSPLVDKLRNEQKELEEELKKLRGACRGSKGQGVDEGTVKYKEMQRLKFVKSMSAAKAGLVDIQNELAQPYDGALPKGEAAMMRQHHLSTSLARLNAALAALTSATSDPANPDYEAANAALATINETLPLVVKETKAMASTRDEGEKKALLEELQKLCDATRGVCDTVHQDPNKLREFAKEFSAASGKLIFVFNPRAQPAAANQVMKQAYEACKTADQTVMGSNKLADQLTDSDSADKLRQHADSTSIAADSLMTSTQLTASSMDDPHCQSALLSSVDALSSSAHQLAQQWSPHVAADELLVKTLDKDHQNLQRQLDTMRREYSKKPSPARRVVDDEQQRQQFVKAAAHAKESLADIDKDGIFTVPYNEPPPKGEAALIRQHHLANSLARLNAALATLASATADPDNVDYDAANKAMTVVSETMPLVVKETKVLSSMKDEKERKAMLEELQKLCDSTRGVCDTAQQDPDKLRDFAKEFGKASGKLMFVLNPRRKPAEANKLTQQAQEACVAADQLVNDAVKLSTKLPSLGFMAESETLRDTAEKTAQASDALKTSTQLTAASVDNPHCQAAVSSAVDALSSSAHHLAQQWAPLHGKADEVVLNKLDKGHQDLQQKLDSIKREYCKKPTRVIRTAEDERKWQQFTKSAAAAKKSLTDIEKELTEPYSGCLPKTELAVCQNQLSTAMARLNAAIASLAAATADVENPDYVAADEALASITELMPLVVKDTKAMASTKDGDTREAMLSELRALCHATRDICGAAGDPRQIRESAKKFSAASGKLVFVVNPRVAPAHTEQIMSQANYACSNAKQLVSDSRKLAEQLPSGNTGLKIRDAADRASEAAEALLTSTQVTAPTIKDPRCQSIILSSVDGLSVAAHHLSQQWAPVHDKDKQALVKKLDNNHRELQMMLENMRKECQGDDESNPVCKESRVRFNDSVAAAKHELEKIEEELNKPYTGALPEGSSKASKQLHLSNSLARLNAALAALTAATADKEKPDYAAAQQAINTIQETLPLVVKETKAMAALEDDTTRKVMLDNARVLCLVAKGICDSAKQDPMALRNFAKNFAAASGKLVYVVNARAKPTSGDLIMEATQAACKSTNQLVKNSSHLADQLGPSDIKGFHIRSSGSKTLDAADALKTTAQLTAPCITDPQCQASLSSSITNLSSSAQELSRHWSPLLQEPLLTPVIRELEKEHTRLAKELDHLRNLSQELRRSADEENAEQRIKQKMKDQYIGKAAAAKQALQAAEKELDKPVPGAPAKGEAAAAQQLQLSKRLAKLHAALLDLSIATTDTNNPDYTTAEQSIDTIRELVPHIVKNANALLASKDSGVAAAAAEDLRGLCHGAQELCDSIEEQDSARFNDQLTKTVMPNLGKLYYVVHPNVGTTKLAKVEACAKSAGSKVSQLLTSVFQLAEATNSKDLDEKGASTADAAKALLTAVQLTGPYIHEKEAQSSLITVADALSSSAKGITAVWQPIVRKPEYKADGETLARQLGELDAELEKFKKACMEPEPENIVHKSSSKSKPLPPPRKPDDEEVKKKQFITALGKVTHGLQVAEEDIKRIYNAKLDAPKMHKDQVRGVQKALERKIALSNVVTSALLACNGSETMDYANAAKHSTELADLMPKIAQDAKVFSNALSEKEKKSFLDDILAMFDSTRKVTDAALNDRKSLNAVAVEYGNKSGSVLYTVCTDFDPSHEKEVISRAKDIGESVSKITLCSAQLMSDSSVGKTNELCAAGKACATAAGNLVYTAKLVAPSIQVAECQDILKKASETLSNNINMFSSAWQPLEVDPEKKACIDELNMKAAKAEGLLEELRKDLESGKLVKLRPLEQLAVEDTPIRKLTAALIENAMKKSSSSSLAPEHKRAYVEYARVLTEASDQLDRANAICKKEPHNLEKSRELEAAVQNLQVLALQSRPSLGNQQQQYIVDLTEYVKELSQETNGMIKAVDSCSVKHKEISTTCNKISADADRILHPTHGHPMGDGTTADDIYEVDLFGRSTDGRVKRIASQIQVLPDCKDKIVLNTQSVNLEDSCNILRFATQSAVATTQSASLDETLHDLTDLEKSIDNMLQSGEKPSQCVDEPIPWSVRSSLLQATRGIASQPQLGAAVAQYADELRVRTDMSEPEASHRLKEHLRKLTYLMRVLLVETSRRVATWQELDGPEVANIMEQVLKEIDVGCNVNQPAKRERSVLQNIDLNRLLLSTDVIKIEGDRKHIEDKMQQTATKLTSMLSTVIASSAKPDSMVRSLTVTADAAGELAALARALKKPDDPVYNAKIEEGVREATFQTYNVLKASELVSQEPNNPAYRRRLLEACRMLNDALNNLGRTTSPESYKMQRECSELSRNLQLQQALLISAQPTCALPYAECLDALQSQHEVIQKLNSDQPMSRAEFTRTLSYISSAVCNSTELAAQCGYLMSLSERDQEATKTGVVDVQQLRKVVEAAQGTCYRVLRFDAEQAKEEAVTLAKLTEELRAALLEAEKKSQHLKAELGSVVTNLDRCTDQLNNALQGKADKAKITAATNQLLQCLKTASMLSEHAALQPAPSCVSAAAEQRADHVLTAARELTNKTASLIRDVKTRAAHGNDDNDEPMTWVTFNLKRKDVVKAFEALLASVRENGQQAGILEVEQKETQEEVPKSYLQLQIELANKWLKRAHCKPDVKSSGEEATRKVIDIAEKMVGDMKEGETEDMNLLISETKELLNECSKKCTPDKASLLVERLKALKKAIERGVITMVVEDLIEGEEPLQDLDILVDSESDESKRKFLLERKLAELLAQLARVTRTARVLADTALGGQQTTVEITKCTEQANLLAPQLVKAAQQRINTPDNKAAIENYKSLLAQYAESLSKVRDLCDRSVDPMEFVQTAGETMQRMREESSNDNDPQKCVYTSTAITKLANRVIQVSMSSNNAKEDPELRKALSEAQQRLQAAVPGPQTRKSTMPDWKDTTAEILRTTGEVEAVMGGEMIFQNQPQSDQPIFAAARELHTAVREWSARDNEIVAVAKRMAVLMAKLSAYMNTNKKHELIVTSKSIVNNAHEVAELARKLAHECSDVRIKTNLLQVCDRIPTISGQLKMLTTVKGSTLSNQGNKEDQESLNMLVDNAQNLMLSIQEVVKVSAGASVRIAAQRGGLRVRWVRRQYY